jgi:hypothetical protein
MYNVVTKVETQFAVSEKLSQFLRFANLVGRNVGDPSMRELVKRLGESYGIVYVYVNDWSIEDTQDGVAASILNVITDTYG